MAQRPSEFFTSISPGTSGIVQSLGFPAGFLTLRNDAARSIWVQMSSAGTVSSSAGSGYEIKSSELYGPLLPVPGITFLSLYSTAASAIRIHALGPMVTTS